MAFLCCELLRTLSEPSAICGISKRPRMLCTDVCSATVAVCTPVGCQQDAIMAHTCMSHCHPLGTIKHLMRWQPRLALNFTVEVIHIPEFLF